jgi:hypothetical protein
LDENKRKELKDLAKAIIEEVKNAR